MSMLDHFPPGFSPREDQRKIIRRINEAYGSGYRHILLCAPTGIGKSHIGACLARTSVTSWTLTSQITLQDQYLRDFKWMADIRGKIHYPCMAMYEDGNVPAGHGGADPSRSCAVGVCTWNTPGGRSVCSYKPRIDEIGSNDCLYYTAKYTALQSRHALANYAAYFALRAQFLPPDMVRRGTCVADEAHLVEDSLVEWVGCDVQARHMRAAGLSFGAYHLDEPDSLRRMLDDVCAAYHERVAAMHLRDGGALPAMSAREERFRVMLAELKQHPENVIVQRLWPRGKPGDRDGPAALSLRPLSVTHHAMRYFDAGCTLWMSATLHPGIFCPEMGLDERDCKFIEVPTSPFPASRSPVMFQDTAPLGRRAGASEVGAACAEVDRIMTVHQKQKGLVLTTSVEQCNAITKSLSRDNRSRILAVHNSSGRRRDDVLSDHAASKSPTVLLSPSLWYGADLRHYLSRFQVIFKAPYPSLSDARTARKAELNPLWYQFRTLSQLLQGCGRSVRSEGDWATTYVVDSNARALLIRMGEYVPASYRDMFRRALA